MNRLEILGRLIWPETGSYKYNLRKRENRMVKRKDIIKELKNRGYETEEHTSIKNGVKFKGIRFLTGNEINPVIYTDDIIRDSGVLPEAVESILEIYSHSCQAGFDIGNLKNPDFVMGNLYIRLQKTSSEDILKNGTDFEGIEKYLYIKIDEDYSFKATHTFMESLNIQEDEAWKVAERNTFAETEIVSMGEMLFRITGLEIEEPEVLPPQYIITNNKGFMGASAVLDKAAIRKLADKYHVHKFVTLPSSIHEMIVMPYNEDDDIEFFNEMVKEVNQSQLEAAERLTDRAYIIEV